MSLSSTDRVWADNAAATGAGVGKHPYLFSPDSEMWRINRYWSGLIFGPASVLLQIAHPRVAQGVVDHSDFRNETLGRLGRTLRSVNRIAFGTRSDAEKLRAHIAHIHDGVQGEVSEGMAGPHRYSAVEPDLLLWVLATLIDASIQGYELIHGVLADSRRERFYLDMRRFGSFFGLEESYGPQDYRSFDRYFQEMLGSDLLGSHPLSAEVAEGVVHPRSSWGTRILGLMSDFLAVECVPVSVASRLRVRRTPWSRVRIRVFRWLAPRLFTWLPARLRYYPESYRAERRLGLL